MSDCSAIDPLVTAHVDGELSAADRDLVDGHLRACPSCRARVAGEASVQGLIDERRVGLQSEGASEALRARCVAAARQTPPVVVRPRRWVAGRVPLAVAATLVIAVGAAALYQLTGSSTRVLAAELAADHTKCFMMNAVLGTHHDEREVEAAMASRFGWNAHLPSGAAEAGLELVGSRPCLYGEGRMAHIMYLHHGQPVSIFMLPGTERAETIVNVMGHEAAVWSDDDRTFVLVSQESRTEVERMASFVHASLR